ncbi:MAG TPA: pyridoxamine 5'-phosphate oxidase family protein [Nitrososphaeraceae archaeon]|nr:pyridoxamine 5'-phosphate oxidase family protein [Nitrososphaeraceae archaeon]
MNEVTFTEGEIKFLCSNEICRIATCNNDLPHVTPVSYIFNKGKFYFATDYNTLKYNNLKKNNRISLVVDTTENNRNTAVVIRGTTTFIHKGRKFENLYKRFHEKFDWVKKDPWKQGEAPFIEVISNTKVSWGF